MSNKKYNEFNSGTPALDDIVLFANPTTGLLKKVPVATAGAIKQIKITKTYADFVANSTNLGEGWGSNSDLITLPAGTAIHGIITNTTTPFQFEGDTISIGIEGDEQYFKGPAAVDSAGDPEPSNVLSVASYTDAVVIKAFMLSNNNIAVATVGSIDIWIYYSVLE